MTLEECKEIIIDPSKSDEEAVRTLILFTGGPSDTPRNAAETIALSMTLVPFFKKHRPNVDPKLVQHIDRENAEERRRYMLAKNPKAQILQIQITPHD